MKKIVVPGEKLEGKKGEFTYDADGSVYSEVVGLYEEKEGIARVVPLNGKYDPKIEDFIIGIVTEPKYGGARVEINAPFGAYMPTPRPYSSGDIVSATVKDVDEMKSVILWDDRKAPPGGIVMDIPSVKVPRVIGKKNSMLEMLREMTGCEVEVGKNGRVWMYGSDAAVAKVRSAIEKIVEEAHTPGLTERIKEYLSKS